MFRCEQCNKVTKSNESMNKLVIEKRPKEYYTLILKKKKGKDKIIRHYKLSVDELQEFTERHWEKTNEFTSKGWEIKKELNVCLACYKNENNNSG